MTGALRAGGVDDYQVARLLEEPGPLLAAPQPPDDRGHVTDLIAGDARSRSRSLDRLNGCDVIIVQHEFGIFGGADGDEVLELLAGLTVPVIVVLHTVLTEPTSHQREVLEAVVGDAGAVVTMTDTARRRLLAGYEVTAEKIHVIAHGAAERFGAERNRSATVPGSRPIVLTWGLLGPGKGIEWGIEAISMLQDRHPAPRYVVAGQTHPKVLQRDGESYREGLERQIRALSLTDSVQLDGRYLDDPALAALVGAADVVLLPYDSTEQVTSGVLIEAVAAGKPVVATRFPHALELLSGGAGIVVPHRDPVSIAEGLRRVISTEEVSAAMSRVASSAAPALRWSAVAGQYRLLETRLIAKAGRVAA
jgi:glycosyltransferase involved in cell wall biosynthesis